MTAVAEKSKGFTKTKPKFIAKAISFFNMFVPERVDIAKGIHYYGKDNRLPNKLMSWVLDSGTAKKAHGKRNSYIAVDGFVHAVSGGLKVNPEQTANQLLTEIAGYQSYFKGFALHIQRDGTGAVRYIKCLPLQDIRKGIDGTYHYNPTLSAYIYDNTKTKILQPYQGVKITTDKLKLVADNGEILYAYNKSPESPHYPMPDYYAGIEDVRSSSELQKFDYETVMNAFITSAILTIIGDVDDETKDDRGMTEWDYWQEELEKFTGEAKDRDGVSGRMRMLIMKARTKEEVPDLKPFDAKVIIDASNSKRDIIDRAVCRLFSVHPVLCGFADAQILGNTQAIYNASLELNKDVVSDQLLIAESMKKLFPAMDWSITTFRPIQFVPTDLLHSLTETERRALVGYPELVDKTSGEISRVRGTTDSLVAILVHQQLTPEQKVSALKIVYGMTTADASSLVTLTVPPPPANP